MSTTLIAFSAIAVLTINSLLLPFNHLLQPAQGQTPNMTFKTPTPAGGDDICAGPESTITFDAQGTASSSGDLKITSGIFNVTHAGEPISYSGKITGGKFSNDSNGSVRVALQGTVEHVSIPALNCSMIQGSPYTIITPCSTSNAVVNILPDYTDKSGNTNFLGHFQGVVECLHTLGGSTQPSSSSMTGTTTTTTAQDSDGDGIPDASDKCTHNSNHRCFKEGGTSNTTTQQPSNTTTTTTTTTTGTGNQTR